MGIMKILRFAQKLVEQMSRICGIISMIFLVGMMLLIVADVFLRFLFNSPVKGSLELTEFFMVLAGFLGIAWCAVNDAHVRVDILVSHLPTRSQAFIDAFTLLLGMTVVPLVAWQGFSQIKSSYEEGTVSHALDIPCYPFYGVVGLGYALLFLVQIIILIKLIKKAIKNEP